MEFYKVGLPRNERPYMNFIPDLEMRKIPDLLLRALN